MSDAPPPAKTPPADVFDGSFLAQSTRDLIDMLASFQRLAPMAGAPTQLDPGSWALFNAMLQTMALRGQREFQRAVVGLVSELTTAVGELVANTRGDNGALDPRAMAREVAQRRLTIAMGPEPGVLNDLAMASQQELADAMARVQWLEQGIRTALESDEGPEAVRVHLAELVGHTDTTNRE